MIAVLDDALKRRRKLSGDPVPKYVTCPTLRSTATNGEVGRRWEILYRLINLCNDVIYYAPDAIGNEELLKRYANEAKALEHSGTDDHSTTFGEVLAL